MASANNTGRNKIKETDLPFHLRKETQRNGNQQVFQIFTNSSDTSNNEIKQFTAGESGSKGQFVMIKSDGLAWKGKAESAYIHRGVGVALEDFTAGNPFQVKVLGSIVDNSLSLDTTKFIYMRNTGSISQTQLTAITGSEDMDVLIGLPISATEYKLLTPFQYIIIL